MSSNANRKEMIPKYFIPTPEEPKRNSPPELGKKDLIVGILLAGFGLLVLPNVFWYEYYIYSMFGWSIGQYVYWFGIVFFLALGAKRAWSWYSEDSSQKKAHEEAFQREMSNYREAFAKAEPKPSDFQMDRWLEEDIEELRKDALGKLDLNDEDMVHDPGKPIIVIGPGNRAQIGIGQDLVIRFSIYDILLVFLTEYHLAAYKCTLDFATKIRTYESTQEYHYADVVSVSTKTGSDLALTVNGETKSLANYQQFALSVASGESINVATPVSFTEQLSGAAEMIRNGKLPDSGADKAIRVIRNRLREKKGGAIN